MESNKGFFRGSIEKMLSELLLLPSLKFTSENGWLESTTLGAMLVLGSVRFGDFGRLWG